MPSPIPPPEPPVLPLPFLVPPPPPPILVILANTELAPLVPVAELPPAAPPAPIVTVLLDAPRVNGVSLEPPPPDASDKYELR